MSPPLRHRGPAIGPFIESYMRARPIVRALHGMRTLPRPLPIQSLDRKGLHAVLEPGVSVQGAKAEDPMRFMARDGTGRWFEVVTSWANWCACWEGTS